jgi:hypothetical protein
VLEERVDLNPLIPRNCATLLAHRHFMGISKVFPFSIKTVVMACELDRRLTVS